MSALDWRLRASQAHDLNVVELVNAVLNEAETYGMADVPLDDRPMVTHFFGYVFRLNRRNLPVTELRCAFRLTSGTATVVHWTDGEGRVSTAYLGPWRAVVLMPLIDALVVSLDGDEFEIDYTLAGRWPLYKSSTLVFPDGWWSMWKARALDESGRTVGEAYAEDVYPWVTRLLDGLPDRPTPWRTLDLMGGDGAALHVVSEVLALGPSVVLDRNRASLDRVPEGLGARTVCADLRDGWPEHVAGPFDLVLAIGALATHVMDPEVAQRVLQQVVARMAPGGVMVLGGWSPALVHSGHLEAAGLTVFNCTRPEQPGVWRGQQLYGAYKPL